MRLNRISRIVCLALLAFTPWAPPAPAAEVTPEIERDFRARLDAPLLFVKRHSYTGIHIYDTYYKWPPGGGGIYILENPSAPRGEWKIRPVIAEDTPGTLGAGVYTHPELSWDARKLLFCYKAEPEGSTSIYEINIDGTGLRRLTDPAPALAGYKGTHGGQHDIAPAYLPDGRIVFLSTRPSGLVPCANEGVSILHVMNADGSDIHPISVNNVNEFDPAVLPDGRLIFGRWEYVDKNALTIQSLWTMNPDGTQETALFANNMVFPESILDARPVPGSHLIIGTMAKHNHEPRGSIAFIDTRLGKNNPQAIINLEHPENPTFDLGNSCEPWPIDENLVIFSGRPEGRTRNALEMIDRAGHRMVLLEDPNICLHSPMLVKPRTAPPVLADVTDRRRKTGAFFVQDIYRGLTGVKKGEVKALRVIEETSRISGRDGGTQPYNQTFLVSAALAFSVKNYLGVVPVSEDGSAYFEAPSGRALYLQALDAEGRLVQSMRTFVQAAPGTVRSCIGCHERKFGTASNEGLRLTGRKPDTLKPESWGTGYMDYPSMIQPVLDARCVECHGGAQGIGGGIDLTGGWTEHFSISYENLVNRRESQLVAWWISGIDCMNGTAHWSSQIFQPRGHGSGAAPLARLLISGHEGRIPGLTRTERDLLLAWIDSNGLYHGTWDATENGCNIAKWPGIQQALQLEMKRAGCADCHGARFESDWFNLERPELSRILRAPLPEGAGGIGLGLCRERKVNPEPRRIRLLWNGYAHAVKPVEEFAGAAYTRPDASGPPHMSFASTADLHYQAMLAIIQRGREEALLAPRVDMPGADVIPGVCRQFNPPPLPAEPLPLRAALGEDGIVQLSWESSARTIGLDAEIYRAPEANFPIDPGLMLTSTTAARFADKLPPAGLNHYALVMRSGSERGKPAYASINVPRPEPPPAPAGLTATPAPGAVRLAWQTPAGRALKYNVYRQQGGNRVKLNLEPLRTPWFNAIAQPEVNHQYTVSAVSLRGLEGEAAPPVTAAAKLAQGPVFTVNFEQDFNARLEDGKIMPGAPQGKAALAAGGVLDLAQAGHVAFPHDERFDLAQPLTVEVRLNLAAGGRMPIPVSCGVWRKSGWFLQRFGAGWRWHVGGIDCDGGKGAAGKWINLACTWDGSAARLYQDGVLAAEKEGAANTEPWPGDLLIGQYSAAPADASFQVQGSIASVKIYHRALGAEEIAAQQPNGQ